MGELEDFTNHIIEKARLEWKSEKEQRYYTAKDVCERLNISKNTLIKYRNEGLIGYTQVNDKFWFSGKDIEDFLSQNYHPSFNFNNKQSL